MLQAVVTLDKNPPKGLGQDGTAESSGPKRALSTAALKRSKTAGLAAKNSTLSLPDVSRSGRFATADFKGESLANLSQRSERGSQIGAIKHRCVHTPSGHLN